MGEMTREQFVDGLIDLLGQSFPDEQNGFQVSPDDINDVQEALDKKCWEVRTSDCGN
jgi:hypothetical protein